MLSSTTRYPRTRRLLSLRHAAECTLLLAAVLACGRSAFAQAIAPGDPIDPTVEAMPSTAPSGEAAPLDPAFVSQVAGISIRPPAGGVMRQSGTGGDEIVRFTSEPGQWTFVVSRIMLNEPMPLVTKDPEAARKDPSLVGFAETLASQMETDTPEAPLRVSELLPVNGNDAALFGSRFSDRDNAKRFKQQAIIRKTDKVYYVLTYITALTPDSKFEDDPAARRAMATMRAMLDTTELLDQEAIARDIDDRLIRTRALMVNWSPDKLRNTIVPEQWLRLIRDGKDIGYTYIVEEIASDVPRQGTRGTEKDKTLQRTPTEDGKIPGVRVGVRSRTMPDADTRVDTESWSWVRADRKQESFRNRAQSVQGTNPPTYAMEAGASVVRDRVFPKEVTTPEGQKEFIKAKEDRIELSIWSTSNLQQLPPLTRDVPPFYLPQAIGHLLPRLLPLREPRTYAFATYLTERRSVVMRYVDVLAPQTVTLPGFDAPQMVIPVQDRAGFEGSITTHYLTPDGRYVGSVNKDAKVTIVTSDAATITQIWRDANLQRPGDVEQPTPTAKPTAKPSGTPPAANPNPTQNPPRTPPGAANGDGIVRPRR